MCDEQKLAQDRQEKVYVEASQWIRLINQIIWGLGSLFVPTSFAALWIATKEPKYIPAAAILSIALYSSWVAISIIYKTSSADARKTLMKIEEEWKLCDDLRLFKHQNTLFSKRVINVITIQIILWFLLVIAWWFFYSNFSST